MPVPLTQEDGGENDEQENDNGYYDSERGPLAEIFYKFFHLSAFNSSGWFLFIGTSVSYSRFFPLGLDQSISVVQKAGSVLL